MLKLGVDMNYQPRIIDEELGSLLSAIGAVVLEGPKAVGKTETASQHAKSAVYLDSDESARQLAGLDARMLLQGAVPRLIDEWQVEPNLWNQIRREVDRRGLSGQFILTGSATPTADATRHSGAGRFSRIRMRPMTLFETKHSTGDVSLSKLFSGEMPSATDSGLTIPNIIDRICIGGWPSIAGRPVGQAQRAMRSYLNEISSTDIQHVSGVNHNPTRVQRVLQSVARNVANKASNATIAADVGGSDGPIDSETVAQYLQTLERLMVIEDLPAWTPQLRSRARVRSASARHFADPCLAVAALNASPAKLLRDLNFLGLLFESLVVRDLRVYIQSLGGRLLQYRDSDNLEVDIILETDEGNWAAVEVKLGVNQIDDGAETLIKFSNKIDTKSCGAPVFMAVVTATGYGYRRNDGVYVLPIGSLKT
jgi:predicted AAA+ superfamily ATPase